jgi:hypothetical protein
MTTERAEQRSPYTVRVKELGEQYDRSVYVHATSPSEAVMVAMHKAAFEGGGVGRCMVSVYPGHHGYHSPNDLAWRGWATHDASADQTTVEPEEKFATAD